MNAPDEFLEARLRMVAVQIEGRGIHTPAVLEAMRGVPRHLFIPPALHDKAYQDGPLPIGHGQTISQPYMVAVMTDLLRLNGEGSVLEIGTGSGYQAAVLARLAHVVHTYEIIPALAAQAGEALQQAAENVCIHIGDGTGGIVEGAPFQGILLTAAAPVVPRALLEQLADGARLVAPVGGPGGQALQIWKRSGSQFTSQTLFEVSFVPLRGSAGWSVAEWGNRMDE